MNNNLNLSDWNSNMYRDIKNTESIFFPVGSFEQHGPHGPYGTDTYIAEYITRILSNKTGIPYLPSVNFGCSDVHQEYKGTITISEKAYIAYLSDVFKSLIKERYKNVLVMNGHGGNIKCLNDLSKHFDEKIKIKIINWWIIGREYFDEFKHDERHHAGAEEISVLMYFMSNIVDDNSFKDTPVLDYNPYQIKKISQLTPTGSIGTVTTASANRGAKYIPELIDKIIEIYELRSL